MSGWVKIDGGMQQIKDIAIKVNGGMQTVKSVWTHINNHRVLLFPDVLLPWIEPIPGAYNATLVASANGATHTIYTVPTSGFYRVDVQAGAGTGHKSAGGVGGAVSKIVYLVAGTRCLMWGGSAVRYFDAGFARTGYPEPTNALGGNAGRGGGSECGCGGAGAANNPTDTDVGYQGGKGGGGAGFIAGVSNKITTNVAHFEPGWSQNITSRSGWAVGSYFVDHAYCYVLAGGGGGGGGSSSSSGGGGGAWGNGGHGAAGWYNGVDYGAGAVGPGGAWGQGGDYTGPGGDGAWCVLDFSCNQWEWGIGGGVPESPDINLAQGFCRLYKLN